MDTDVSLDEIQNKLSAWCHFVTAVTLVTFSSLNASANVRKGFKQKNTLRDIFFKYIYPRGMGIWNGMGGYCRCERYCCWGEDIWVCGLQCSHGRGRYLAKLGGGGMAGSRHAASSCHTHRLHAPCLHAPHTTRGLHLPDDRRWGHTLRHRHAPRFTLGNSLRC